MSEHDPVRYAVTDGVAVITVDNPPVNALNTAVREGVAAGIDRAAADPSVVATVLIGAGRNFIAGADIRQFGTVRAAPLRRTTDAMEESGKPVVAAIDGYALGGGLEYALACHYRIATGRAKVGLPEVKLGILPGGGGTQRLPRVVGAEAALDMILTGRHVPANEALAMGLLDAVVPDGLEQAAIAFALSKAGRGPWPRARDGVAQADPVLFADRRKRIARSARNQQAPFACIESVENACTLPFDEGVSRERALFEQLVNREEARALRYAFFAERQVARLRDWPKDAVLPEIRTVGVVGAGTMGGGIAMSLADAGLQVKIAEQSQEALERGMARIRSIYATSVRRGSVTEDAVAQRMARIEPVSSLDALAACDAVIEAVFEDLAVKRAVFAELDRVVRPGALLLSNTSALRIDSIASATKRPQDVAGAHYFSPANVMKLLEVVKGADTGPATVAATMSLGRKTGKIAAAVGDCDGFAANRSRAPFNAEMNIMLEEGVLPEQVDRVMVEFGYPMGPFAVGDLAGLDISYASRQRRAAADPNYRKLVIADRLVEAGRKGQKTGAGWFRYEAGDRTPRPDPVVADLIRRTAAELGVPPRELGDEEILRRLLFASVNETCRILEDGIIARASDMDAIWLNAFGFPRYRGGPMFWADGIGASAVLAQVEEWHSRYGERWAPASLLRRTAETGGNFRELTARAG